MLYKFISGLGFFFCMICLYFWWFSRSSSVSLMMVMVYSILSVMIYSFSMSLKLPLFMIVLTLSGGLFVLVSFVIMFFPEDNKMGLSYAKKMFFFCVLFFLLSESVSFLYEGVGFGEDLYTGSMKVWGNFVFVYLYLIVLLFLFLFVLNCLVNPSTGSMFSKKKKSNLF